MGTVHRLSRVREQKPLPTLPGWALDGLGELGIFSMGPVVGFELWGRGRRSAVMMMDGLGTALNACLSPSHPREGFPCRAAARDWAVAFFAGLGRDVPEIKRSPANLSAPSPSAARAGNEALDDQIQAPKDHPND